MKKVFFIGINGIGMSGLAKIMAKSGYCVSGSDQTKKDVSIELESLGVKIHYEKKNPISINHTSIDVCFLYPVFP